MFAVQVHAFEHPAAVLLSALWDLVFIWFACSSCRRFTERERVL